MYNFIHVPKVAGSSLYQLIGGFRPVGYCGHVRAVDVQFFCFVRNPYDRLVDAYVYLIGGGGMVEPDLSYQKTILKYNGFTDFVLNIEKDGLFEMMHIAPMVYYTCDDSGKLLVRPFKIEEPEKIDAFLNEIGVEGKLSEVRVNVTERLHYSKYLNKANIKEINRLYAKDFEVFGYETL